MQPVTASFRYHGRPATEAQLEVRHWDSRQRLMRAIKGLGICWGAALFAVLLPVLHWVLVPSLLIGGPLFAFLRYHERMTVLAARGSCPACGVELSFALGQASRRRMLLRCDHCGRGITLEVTLLGE